jgi:hypothetical protein
VKPRLLIAFLLLCFVAGCGGERLPPGMPKLYPAAITVTQDGKPLEGANIVLFNIDSDAKWSAGGVTDQDGVLKLRTMGRYAGAPAGTYKVSVSKIETPGISLPDEPSTPEARREYNRIAKEIENNTFYTVDPKFGLGKTKLEVEITPTNLKLSVDVSPAVRIKVPPEPRG